MTPQVWVIVGLVVSAVGAFAAARVAGRATVQAARTSADEGAFTRATEIYRATSEEQDKRTARLQHDLQMTLERIERLEQTAEKQATEIHTLRRSVATYEGRVMQLEATLRASGIEVPPWTLLPGDVDLFGPPHTEA